MASPVNGIRPVFFVGGQVPLADEPDTIALDCPDTYEALPAKIRAFFYYALKHESFDWLFKCDDDTYVAQSRLHDLTIGSHELAGNAEFLGAHGYASGGAGYMLSRRIVAILADDSSLPSVGCEDIIMTKAAISYGAVALPSPRLVWTVAPSPRPDNDIITCHWCDPRKMSMVHAGLTDELHARFHVTHRHWKDLLYLYKKGGFCRASSGCAGNWHVDSTGALNLKWFDWEEEVVKPDHDGYQSEVMQLVPTLDSTSRAVRQGILVVHLMGGLGNQMFQYAHGLALSRRANAELKLVHVGWGRPFALHLFGLSLSADVHENVPVISDESGYSPGMDIKIWHAVENAMKPIAAIRGYFQNEQFFSSVKDEIRQQFRLRPKHLPEYGDRMPVCVHVRRGDFVNHPLHDVCAPGYYESARKIICSFVDKPCFVLISDDIDWCKQTMSAWPDTIFYTSADVQETFAVMCSCHAFIISNSTFAWWAAWLSGSRLVIRPDRFLNNTRWEIGLPQWIHLPGEGVHPDIPRSSTKQLLSAPSVIVRGAAENGGSTDELQRPSYRVLSYRNGGNFGDTFQTLALARLLPEPLEGVYRDSIERLQPGPVFVVNGYLCETPFRTCDCLFAGIYIGGRKNEQLEWIRESRYPVGARDPATVRELEKAGIESEMIGCSTLTLPKYTGPRSGCLRIDDLAPNCNLTQVHNDLPWFLQCEAALKRLELLKTAELVVTTRLHVVLPCLAYGTPVLIPSKARKEIFEFNRLSLLDDLGFEYDKPNVIDVSDHALRYLKFLKRTLGIHLCTTENVNLPDPVKWADRPPPD